MRRESPERSVCLAPTARHSIPVRHRTDSPWRTWGSTPWNLIEMTGSAEGATHGVQDPATAGFVPVCSRVTGIHLHPSQEMRATQEGSGGILPAVTRHLPNNPLAQRSFYRRQTKKTKHASHIVCFRFLLWPSISARHIALDETTTRASQGRTSKDAMTVVMVSPLFIVELSFLRFVLYLSFGKFLTALQKFSKPGFFTAELHGLHGSRPDQETKRKPLSNIAFTTS